MGYATATASARNDSATTSSAPGTLLPPLFWRFLISFSACRTNSVLHAGAGEKLILPPPVLLLGQAGPGPAQSSGPGLAQKRNFLGRDRPNTFLGRPRPIIVQPSLLGRVWPRKEFLGRDRPNTFWADLGPSWFWAESDPVVWAGPARFNIYYIYIYIIFCIIYIYIYIHEKIIKIMQKL